MGVFHFFCKLYTWYQIAQRIINVHITEDSHFLDSVLQKQFDDGSLGSQIGEPHSQIIKLRWFVKIKSMHKEEFATI